MGTRKGGMRKEGSTSTVMKLRVGEDTNLTSISTSISVSITDIGPRNLGEGRGRSMNIANAMIMSDQNQGIVDVRIRGAEIIQKIKEGIKNVLFIKNRVILIGNQKEKEVDGRMKKMHHMTQTEKLSENLRIVEIEETETQNERLQMDDLVQSREESYLQVMLLLIMRT